LNVGDTVSVTMELDFDERSNKPIEEDYSDIIQHYKKAANRKSDEIMTVFESIFTRRSIRNFTGEVIKDSDLSTIIKAGCYAPSAENKQPWHFVIIKDKLTLEKISKNHPRAKMLTQAGCGIVVCGDKNIQSQVGFLVEDCSAAIENMLLAANGLGLGTVWCGLYPMTQFTKPMKVNLNLPTQIIPIGLVVVGYPNEEKGIVYRYDEKKVHFEKW